MVRIVAVFLFISGPHAAEISLVPEDDPLTEATHQLVWATLPWEFYTVEYAEDAGGPWAPLTNPIKGDGTLIQYSFGLHFDSRLYRVRSETLAFLGDTLALIPAGSFMMGDSFDDGTDDELPVHDVFLSAFYIGKTEVTWAQWRNVRDWALDQDYDFDNPGIPGPGKGSGDDHPVRGVSWYDVVKWCNALSEREGLEPVYRLSSGGVYRTGDSDPEIHYGAKGYRLPSEAEWEKAARGGLRGRRFPWGDTISHDLATYYSFGNGQVIDYDESFGALQHPEHGLGTVPVGSFPANGYGLYDVAGNVREWVNDWHDWDHYATSAGQDPRGPASSGSSERVNRGGAWNVSAREVRVAERSPLKPSNTPFYVGFRVARSP